MSESPLAEADPTSLEEYFSRDPNDLLDRDIDLITKTLRAARKQWLTDEAAGVKRGRVAKPSAAKLPQGLALDDISLDL